MPFIDAQTGSLTLRIVYDGPPLAGKTTSVKSLAQHVRGTRGFTSPAEAEGRTLYFDWLEFVGGEYGGKELHVHVISVPGQSELRHRRNYLIDQADAVVFVADTRDGRFGPALELFAELAPLVRAQEPPVGLVFQANKRDAPDALDMAIVRGMLTRFGRVTLVDSVATDGAGIRDAFAMALRHALDRTQLLVDSRALQVSDQDFLSADELLGRLQDLDEEAVAPGVYGHERVGEFEFSGSPSELDEVAGGPAGEVEWVPGREQVFTPDAKLPSGQIWPPVDGRAIVHEASGCGLVPVRTASGDWWASTGGWRFHSWGGAVYGDLTTARSRLIEWARTHAVGSEFLSDDRALMLAPVGDSQFRLWQLVRVFPSLREGMLGDGTAAEFAVKLREAAQHLLRARAALAALRLNLRCSLWTIGQNDKHQTVFVGLMPSPTESVRPDLEGASLIERELLPIIRSVSKNFSLDELVDHLQIDDSDVSLDLVSLVRAAGGEGARAP